MKVLGVVQWTNLDKHGSPIAGVRPLIEIQKGDWRSIDADEEFPSQGQVFWPNSQLAVEDTLIVFRPEPNTGQKYEFRVADPKPAYEVLDLRQYGTVTEVHDALVEGIRLPLPVGINRALVWCKPSVLVGPVELKRADAGIVKLAGGNLARVQSYTGAQVRAVVVGERTRWLRVDDAPPSGYVDWDDAATVLRRAVDVAVRVSKQAGHEPGQTKKQIEEAAKALAAQGVGPEAKLNLYRLERALVLLQDTDFVLRCAADLAELLREHPAIKTSLETLSERVRADVELSARADIEQRLSRELAALNETTESHARTKSQLEAMEQELRRAKDELVEIQSKVANGTKEAEAALEAHLLAALDRPLDLLAEVSVLRPFFGNGGRGHASPQPGTSAFKVDWSGARGDDVTDKVALRRILTSAARARGVDPSLMLRMHSAFVARLMPITLGPAALAALTAYAYGACAGRILIVHVSPSAIQPHDFDELPGGGLLAAAAAARDVNGLSVAVLEGANRAPLEASLLPLLQLTDVGLSPLASADGLRLAATLVAGATTVPVTPQIWNYAAAIYPDPTSSSVQTGGPGDLVLSSDLLVPGDEPTATIDTLLDAWPECRELRPVMSRFGSALARLYEAENVQNALLHGLILPYIVTAFTLEEQTEAVDKAGGADGTVAQALRLLRRRIA